MSVTAIQIAARELHEAAARLDILNADDGYRYSIALERFEKAKERMSALLDRDQVLPAAPKRAA